jgi:threonine dehydrogenase-like Zn-dependent dehydrogenase
VTEGDVVALEEYLPCGHCDDCRRGDFRACRATDSRNPNAIRYGSTPVARSPSLWGGYSQYLYLHPRSMFHRVPDGVPPHIAAMALPIGNGFQWVHFDGHAGPGKTVLIQGPGQQGLGCVVAAKACGADTIVISGLAKDAHRFAAAKALGADHTVAVDQVSLHDELKRITGGAMADIVIDCSGGGPDLINTSLDLTARGGVFMIAARKWAPVPNFDVDKILTNRMSIKALRGLSFQAVEMALKTMVSGKFPLERMSSHVIGLRDVHHGLRMMGGESQEPSIHITVDPWKT